MAAHDECIFQLLAVHKGERDPVPLLMTQVEPVMVDGLDALQLHWLLVRSSSGGGGGEGGGGEWRGRV